MKWENIVIFGVTFQSTRTHIAIDTEQVIPGVANIIQLQSQQFWSNLCHQQARTKKQHQFRTAVVDVTMFEI